MGVRREASPRTLFRRLALLVYVIAITMAVAVPVTAFFFLVSLYEPVSPGSDVRFTVEIPEGSHTRSIGAILHEKGLIKSEAVFRLLARWSKKDGRLKAGEYELGPGMALSQILEKLYRGEAVRRSFTVPEGLTVKETARLLAEKGIGPAAEMSAALSDPALISDLVPAHVEGLEYPTEGYLFPDTYVFQGKPPAREIARMMVGRFRDIWSEELARRAREGGLSLHEVVTLASIVEREARAPEERPIIAGVYLNRLRQGMKLDADPTVRYALGKKTEPLLYKDLKVESPYNTYLHAGLPPGPIASPGLDSIRAVLNPADVPYLYFVAESDGRHVFSRTLSEHNRNVARIQSAARN